MTRMGKMVPESTVSSLASAPKKTTANTTAAAGTSALKKIYCAPKINFVGETRLAYMCTCMEYAQGCIQQSEVAMFRSCCEDGKLSGCVLECFMVMLMGEDGSSGGQCSGDSTPNSYMYVSCS